MCDKHPADYCVIYDISEVISVFYFVVGYLRVMRVVNRHEGNTMYKLLITTLLLTVSSTNYADCNKSLTRTAPDNRYELLNNNTEVKDKETGLIWQRCSLGQTWSGTSCTGRTTEYGREAALQAAKKIGSGWRMPNVKELRSLVEFACYSPAINEVFFPNTQHGESRLWLYWSSSLNAYNDGDKWVVDFSDGGEGRVDYINYGLVRLVRSE
jgi:hypothetical protein